jgi:hypothetical protein
LLTTWLNIESPVVTVICNSESYWMGQGRILMVTSIQKWDTAFSGGILNFESWYPSWILKKYLNFRPWILLTTCTNVFAPPPHFRATRPNYTMSEMREILHYKVEHMRNMNLECFSAKCFSSPGSWIDFISTPLQNGNREANELVFWMTK